MDTYSLQLYGFEYLSHSSPCVKRGRKPKGLHRCRIRNMPPFLRKHQAKVDEWCTYVPLPELPGFPEYARNWAAYVEIRAGSIGVIKPDPNHVNDQSPDGNTPLHKAVKEVDIVQMLLLLRAGADPNLVDNDHNTALHLACINPARFNPDRKDDLGKMISILLTFGADIDASDRNGRNPETCLNTLGWDLGKAQFNIFRDVHANMKLKAQAE